LENSVTSALLSSKAFSAGGLYVMRSERIYLAAVCHRIGVNGIAPHKHNDWLSFELCVDGKPVIVDPGTYCYTSNMEIRRLFRSTAYHNTVVIDGEEQITIHNSMFSLINPHGEVRVLRWETNAARDLLEAEHTGYTRLSDPVVHRRRFVLDKSKNQVEITDIFSGEGEHTVEWYLHLEIGLGCQVEAHKALVFKEWNSVLEVELTGFKIIPEVQNGLVSRSYNRSKEAKVVCWKKSIDFALSPSLTQRFSIHSSFFKDKGKCQI
jgi:hypothetical protein